jgi:hypothetical protein
MMVAFVVSDLPAPGWPRGYVAIDKDGLASTYLSIFARAG